MNLLRTTLAAALSVPVLAQAAEEGVIKGHVGTTSNVALNAAEVVVVGTDLKTHTDRAGNFVLTHVPAGTQSLEVSYVGLPSKTLTVTVGNAAEATVTAELGDGDTTTLAPLVVEGEYAGQAKAYNDQRSRNNLTSILSSDLSGQFPDKTIADAVKRLPGVTVETDTDTGGSEGRYITLRGMSSTFNAVTVNGVRVGIANADDTISRQVPLDVISAKSADSIVVTKSLRPDQDGDSIGGSVDIITHSSEALTGPKASAEFALGYRHILEGYKNYRFSNPNYEGAFNYGNRLTKDGRWSFELSGNARVLTSQKQRVSTYDWDNISTTGAAQFMIDGLILQDFFDHLTNEGASLAVDGKPTANTRLHFNAAYNLRRTDRGRQRQVIWYGDEFDSSSPEDFTDYISGTPTVSGDTVTGITTTENRLTREAREFHEDQSNINLSLNGDTRLGDTTLTYLAGFNRGEYKGDPNRDIWARFDTRFISDNTYSFASGDYNTPSFSTSIDRNDPSYYQMRAVYLDTDVITDDEADFGLDAKYDTELAGHRGYWKIGAKARLRTRERENHTRAFLRNRSWNLGGYADDTTIPSMVASYGSDSLVNGKYDYGFYVDPALVRATALKMEKLGYLEEDTDGNELNSKLYSYDAHEDVTAAYAMGEFNVTPKLSLLAGVRAERTAVKFNTVQQVTSENDDGDTVTSLVKISPKNTYTNVMPGVQFRYDVKKNVTLRGSVNQSISRPGFSDLNPREFRDLTEMTISRGNINLKPVTSTNYDLSLDYYLGSSGVASIAFFHKQLKNNIYSPGGLDTVVDGDTYTLDEPRNAEGGRVTGIELAYDRQLRFLPEPFNGLGLSTNWTHAESKVYTGIAANPTAPLFDQVKDTVNAGLYYDKYRFRARLSFLYRAGSNPTDYGVNANTAALNRVLGSSKGLDFTVSYRLADHWTIYGEVQNILNTPGRAVDGKGSKRLDYNEYTDWNAQLGLRWNL